MTVAPSGSIILAADGSLSLKVKSCGSDHVVTEARIDSMNSPLRISPVMGDSKLSSYFVGYVMLRPGAMCCPEGSNGV